MHIALRVNQKQSIAKNEPFLLPTYHTQQDETNVVPPTITITYHFDDYQLDIKKSTAWS